MSNNAYKSIPENKKEKIYGLQFHPEVHHTKYGQNIIRNFVFKVCKIKHNWILEDFIDKKIQEIKKIVKQDNVICGLSGGVDSSVTAYLLHKAIGNNLYCIFVNHGFLRKNELNEVSDYYKDKFKKQFITIDASKIFFKNLRSIKDPEKKRKIIGKTFIEVFNRAASKIDNATNTPGRFMFPKDARPIVPTIEPTPIKANSNPSSVAPRSKTSFM